jgi:hypothetical protein
MQSQTRPMFQMGIDDRGTMHLSETLVTSRLCGARSQKAVIIVAR